MAQQEPVLPLAPAPAWRAPEPERSFCRFAVSGLDSQGLCVCVQSGHFSKAPVQGETSPFVPRGGLPAPGVDPEIMVSE